MVRAVMADRSHDMKLVRFVNHQPEDSTVSSHPSDVHLNTRDLTAYLLSLLAIIGSMLSLSVAQAEDQQVEQRRTLAGISTNCSDCGVVRAIREVRTERERRRPDVSVGS